MAFSQNDTHPKFIMNSESNYDSIAVRNVGPAPSYKTKPGGRLKFEYHSFISDSASEAESLFLPKEDNENSSMKNPSYKKLPKSSQNEEDKNADVNLVSRSEAVWDYLKEQDEKLKVLQNQVSSFLLQEKTSNHVTEKSVNETATQTSICSSSEAQSIKLKGLELNHHQNSSDHLSNPIAEKNACESVVEATNTETKELELNEHNNSKVDDHCLTLILRYLKEQNDQIRKLQDQVDLVVKRTVELESIHSMIKGPKENNCEFSKSFNHLNENCDSIDQNPSSPFNGIKNHKRKERKTPSPEFDSDQENKLNSKREILSPEFSPSQKLEFSPISEKYSPDFNSKPCKERYENQNSIPSSRKNRNSKKRSSRSSMGESPDRRSESEEYNDLTVVKEVDSSNITVYGLSSNYLTLDTINYLEKHNLVKPSLKRI